MTTLQAKKRIEELKKVINRHRYLYHVLDRLEISEAALDSLKHELKQLEDQYPEFITSDSPTQRIGGKPLEKFAKVVHKVRQWSLEDAFSENEIREWSNRVERFLGSSPLPALVGELKIDGFHIVLTYENGLLVNAATRGDGETGEDVTQNLRTVESIPLSLARPVSCVVEGEVFMRKSVWETLNAQRKKKGEPLFANPRNAAAGAIRQLDPSMAAKRRLDSFMYDFVWPDDMIPPSQHKELEMLSSLGFKVNTHWKKFATIDGAVAFWKEWETKKEDQDYWIDGVVVKVDERSLQEKLGYTGKAPRWAIAAKFSPEEKTTIIEDIVPFVGRTGKLTPVAFLKPVELKGSIVSRASLHNYDEIARLDVRKGDTVVVRKAGDVIPQITSVVKELRMPHAKVVHVPRECPMCGFPVRQAKGEVDFFCSNKKCGALRTKQLIYFASKAGLDIEGLGEKNIQRFIDEGFIEDIIDIFDITPQDIQGLPGFGPKSAANIASAIQKAKEMPLWRFVNALGIDYVGKQTAIWIQNWFIANYGNLENPRILLEHWRTLTPDDFAKIPGIGPKASQSMVEFIGQSRHQKLLEALAHRGVRFIYRVAIGLPLEGKTFLFTGSLASMSRGQAEKQVVERGGTISGSVSKSLTYLVAGADPGSKVQKAHALGVPIINEQTFLAMLK